MNDTNSPDMIELGRITITYGIDSETNDPVTGIEQQGDAENYLTALGLLAAAIDTVNYIAHHGDPGEGEYL